MREENFGPVANADGTPTEFTNMMMGMPLDNKHTHRNTGDYVINCPQCIKEQDETFVCDMCGEENCGPDNLVTGEDFYMCDGCMKEDQLCDCERCMQ